jgi:hypothetical protein
VILERLGDINTVCSHCCFMVPDHVSCIFEVVELWTKFETWMFLIMLPYVFELYDGIELCVCNYVTLCV